MKRNKLLLGLSIINYVLLLAVTLRLPESIPIHVNMYMMVDYFGSRWILMIFGLIPIVACIGFLLRLKKGKPYKNQHVEKVMFPCIVVLFIAMTWLSVYVASQYDIPKGTPLAIPFELIVLLPLGIFIIIISNYMAKLKQNRWIGIRVPWVFKSETIWRKTHRLGGYTGVAGGLVMCIGAGISYATGNLFISIAGLIIGVLLFAAVPIIYSYCIYKKEIS